MLGEYLPFQAGNEALCTDFRLRHYVEWERKDIEFHSHEYFECIFFRGGDISYQIGRHHYVLEQGDILILGSAVLHHPLMRSADPPYDRLSLTLDRGFLHDLSTEKTDFCAFFDGAARSPLLRPSPTEDLSLQVMLEHLSNLEEKSLDFGGDVLRRACLAELLVTLGRLSAWESMALLCKPTDMMVYQVCLYVASHLCEELSLDALAGHFFLSKYFLSHEFSRQTGISLHAYITKQRLVASKEYLRRGESIAVLCVECGFGDPSTFFRAFKKEFGVSPRRYYAKG